MTSKTQTIRQYYEERFNKTPFTAITPGHFEVFNITEDPLLRKNDSTYKRRDFYKIKLIKGHYRIHYADNTIEIKGSSIFFIHPYMTCKFELLAEPFSGYVCLFTEDYFHNFGNIKEYPVFMPGGHPVFPLDKKATAIFTKQFTALLSEQHSDYRFRADVLRNITIDIIHKAQKLIPDNPEANTESNANARLAASFFSLLEKQFPLTTTYTIVNLKTARDFAKHLSVHTNHLNRAIKFSTGKTTTQLIKERFHQEAKTLLKHTVWNISEIGYCLGFDDTSHFIATFKSMASVTPKTFRANNSTDQQH